MARRRHTKKTEETSYIDKFRDFLLKYWKVIVGVVALIIIIPSAYYTYTYFKEKKLKNASLKYYEFQDVMKEGMSKGEVDEDELEEYAEELEKDYSGTIYYPMALYQLGNYYFMKGDYDTSMKNFEKCIDNTDDRDLTVSSRWGMGDCYYAKREYEKAIDIYQEIYDEYPNNDLTPYVLLKMCYSYLEIDKPDKTYECANDIIINYPTSSIIQEARKLREFVDTF